MPKKIQKTLQDYISKIKAPRPQTRIPSKKWVLSGCRHPRTPSFAMDEKKNNNNKDDEATLADIDRFLFENFKSLYITDDEESDNKNHEAHNTKRVISEEVESHDHDKAPKVGPILFDGPPLDLYGSNRFFMKHGFSDSLMETTTSDEAGSSSTTSTRITINDSSPSNSHRAKDQGMDQTLPDKCVVVLACSPSPYEDFHRSMQGMVETRLRNNESVDWDFMEELLFCYMNLNEKKSYKFILSAFVDLITAMRRHLETPRPAVKPRSVRTIRIGREVRKKTKEVMLKFES